MIVTHHREKLINAIIYFAEKTRYCGKTKLLKLMYFFDFTHFKQTGEILSLPYDEAKEKMDECSEMFKVFGGALT